MSPTPASPAPNNTPTARRPSSSSSTAASTPRCAAASPAPNAGAASPRASTPTSPPTRSGRGWPPTSMRPPAPAPTSSALLTDAVDRHGPLPDELPVWLNKKPSRSRSRSRSTSSCASKGRPHRIRVGLPPTGRPLNIGEQKRHHPRRSSRRHGIASAHAICPSKPSDVAMAR